MVEQHGGESLARGGGTEIGVETERLVDGQVSLDREERSAKTLLLLEDVTTTAGEEVGCRFGQFPTLSNASHDGEEVWMWRCV